ncbi:hypothetical protein LTR56_026964 [Elasticomyces elasticus]|nr:hypothetical protein LTR56_026964 [Elasticomyces elasticus]KAK3616904.1 hypothetical protein LTR22_026917 [Elasticomyces elasticus]KAK4900752.1 hypothetical protein LTR49_027386 [Elasticomyces elasticus]
MPLPSEPTSTGPQQMPSINVERDEQVEQIEQIESTSPRDKRKAQNRASQRAFRERHIQKLRDFETQAERLGSEVESLRLHVDSLHIQNAVLQRINAQATVKLIKARDIIATLKLVSYSERSARAI